MGICHDLGSIKKEYLFSYSNDIMVREFFTRFCAVWLNLPPPPMIRVIIASHLALITYGGKNNAAVPIGPDVTNALKRSS